MTTDLSLNRRLSALCLLLFAAPAAQGAITLSDWQITANTLSFTLSGTASVASTPAANRSLIWMYDPGNTSWINNLSNPTVDLTGNIDGIAMPEDNFPVVFSFDSGSGDVGLYLETSGMGPGPGPEFNFADALENGVNLQITLTSNGKYNPANINPADLQLFWGGDPFSGDSASAVNLGLIPEPSVPLMSLAATCFLVFRRRK